MKRTKIHEYLTLEEGDKRIIKCAKCGFEYCTPSENYKLHALMHERPVTDISPLVCDPKVYLDEDWVFREYYCPGCGVMIDNEIARNGEKPRPYVIFK